ncbi:hypothetical protein PR202_ga02563 [Eleusine coracana subsp. coracana]|uniref:Amino acid transporter transmembrane domain-containing protein n=1 Tax=Eleusine coracana subsp. coracana TaxID=191504 RepID=A0AAV5BN29_ELECO|nr:hypothetical protein PR202_ga02563 [Eleusine coracana subsp. coracana]
MGGSGGEAERQTESLLGTLPVAAEPSHIVKRTGTVWTAMAHIITAVIGSGVLSLAWSVAQLGWVGGPVAMVFFAGVTAVQSSLLADCYIFHDPERGVVRNRSYVDAVRLYLGEKSQMFCGFFLNFSLFGTGVVYTLTSATSMRAIQKANCYHREGHEAPCSAGGEGYYMLAFGLTQVVLSQIPDFHNMAGLSVFAAAMSFLYAIVGVIGLLGAFTFWPLGIHLPAEMYMVKNKVAPWTKTWLAIKAFSGVCLLICLFASIGSAVGVFGSETS